MIEWTLIQWLQYLDNYLKLLKLAYFSLCIVFAIDTSQFPDDDWRKVHLPHLSESRGPSDSQKQIGNTSQKCKK